MSMFKYCPACASQKIVLDGHRFHCPDCGFVYYHNTAAATGCVIRVAGGKILLLVRGRDPSKGKLDLPGGFVDPGEGALEGLSRELREEIGWDIPPNIEPRLFASFPNIYPYHDIIYNTCDLFFTIDVSALTEKDLHLEEAEVGGMVFLNPVEIKDNDLAFDSTRKAIQAYKRQFVN
jgi:ADP-ribose pyrophosphatase YjhB (NUDIX family)